MTFTITLIPKEMNQKKTNIETTLMIISQVHQFHCQVLGPKYYMQNVRFKPKPSIETLRPKCIRTHACAVSYYPLMITQNT